MAAGRQGFFTESRQTILAIIVGVQLLVLLVLFARWYGRTRGWRNSFSRVRGYVCETGRDLIGPVVAVYRFHRGARQVGAALMDADLPRLVSEVTASVREALADYPAAAPCSLQVSPSSVTVGLAGPMLPPVAPPWHQLADGRWQTGRDEASRLRAPTGSGAQQDHGLHVAVGVLAGALITVDLEPLPAVIEIDGDERAARALACAMAAQLDAGLLGAQQCRIIVADGVHPRFTGTPLSVALERLAPGAVDDQQWTVLVCAQPTTPESVRVIRLTAAEPRLRVIVVGTHPGARLHLSVSDTGRLRVPELGIEADAAPLELGVARGLRRSATGRAPGRSVAADARLGAATESEVTLSLGEPGAATRVSGRTS